MELGPSDDSPALIAQALADRLAELGVCPAEGARRAGVPRSSFHEWLRGRHRPTSPRSLSAVAGFLGWDVGRALRAVGG